MSNVGEFEVQGSANVHGVAAGSTLPVPVVVSPPGSARLKFLRHSRRLKDNKAHVIVKEAN